LVLDILNAARRIEQYLDGVDFNQFEDRSEKQSAVLHQLMVLGEAAKRLSPEFRAQHARVPWARIAGMRDRLIHAYDEVDLQLVWESVTDALPPIVEYLRGISPPSDS